MNEIMSAARTIVELLLSLVDVSTAKQLLDEAAIKRANLAADLAEKLKFGSK